MYMYIKNCMCIYIYTRIHSHIIYVSLSGSTPVYPSNLPRLQLLLRAFLLLALRARLRSDLPWSWHKTLDFTIIQ